MIIHLKDLSRRLLIICLSFSYIALQHCSTAIFIFSRSSFFLACYTLVYIIFYYVLSFLSLFLVHALSEISSILVSYVLLRSVICKLILVLYKLTNSYYILLTYVSDFFKVFFNAIASIFSLF